MRILFFTIFFIVSCSKDEIVNDKTFTIFEDQKILFDAGLIDNDAEIIRTIGSGRVVLKKIELPETGNFHRAEAIITLKSSGDPWDKSGSFFILPEADFDNLKEVTSLELLRFIAMKGEKSYPVWEMKFSNLIGYSLLVIKLILKHSIHLRLFGKLVITAS